MEEHFPLHLSVVAIKKGALESPSTKVANFPYSWFDSEFSYPKIINKFFNTVSNKLIDK